MTFTPNYNLRPDLLAVAEMVKSNTRVLDVGCGDGALLYYLLKNKHIDGRGIELSMDGVNACVATQAFTPSILSSMPRPSICLFFSK